jgi:hypothetical protein
MATTASEASGHSTLGRLRAVSAQRAVVLLGGEIRAGRLSTLQRRTRFERLEWIPSTRWQALPRRVAIGVVDAVVFLDGLLGHGAQGAVLAETRRHGIPVAYAHRGGYGALTRAFADVEAQLESHALIGEGR